MNKVKRRSGKAGLPPGSLVVVSEDATSKVELRTFIFDVEGFTESTHTDVNEVQLPPPTGKVGWLDVDGLSDGQLVGRVGERFCLHALLVEDVLNTDQRPKIEEYSDTLFIVVKMLSLDDETGGIVTEQVSLVLGANYVISFQEKPGDVLDPIRERIRKKLGRVRKSGSDYLLYALLDVIVDNYFLIVEDLGERIEELERKVTLRPGNEDLVTIQELRGLLITVNRYVTPARELAGRMNTIQSTLIDKSTRRYINDLQDHTVYIAETIGTFREMLTNLENTYHAGQNARMMQVMKLLTIISTIFIPLTFIVGIFGMNFDWEDGTKPLNMPEIHWKYGYPVVMGSMAVIALIMLAWFRRKRWL
ncbi:MAG: magnesium/cobalt transporter CorA [Flavobacteriales bacterium]|nr:magnesium/cobalt transporter CorA [Flavobacteriales bacterium]